MLFRIGVVNWKEVSVCEQENLHAFSYARVVSAEGAVFNILHHFCLFSSKTEGKWRIKRLLKRNTVSTIRLANQLHQGMG